MRQKLLITLLTAVSLCDPSRLALAEVKPVRTLKVSGMDFRVMPPPLVFGTSGELYVACRDRGAGDTSSSLSVVALDVTGGQELRRSRLTVPSIKLVGPLFPPLARLIVSRDG